MEINVNLINGNEIIDFLNNLNFRNEELCDVSIEGGSFVFENQKIVNNEYMLDFTASYNNWGESQDIYGNTIHIKNKRIWFDLNEPFECDDEVLEKVVTEWLKTHTFQTNLEEEFDNIMEKVYHMIPQISYTKEGQKDLQNVIAELEKANTYIK